MNDDAIARQKQLLDQVSHWEKSTYSPPSFSKEDIPEKNIKVKVITDWSLLANLPTKSHPSDAGWDLYSVERLDLQPGERHSVYTGIAFEIPRGYVGLIWPRSGMSVKKGIDVLAGVVDSGYRGEVKVCLLNTGDEPCIIKKGDRIAQILFQEVPEFDLEIVEEFSKSDRGEGGFGSTGY